MIGRFSLLLGQVVVDWLQVDVLLDDHVQVAQAHKLVDIGRLAMVLLLACVDLLLLLDLLLLSVYRLSQKLLSVQEVLTQESPDSVVDRLDFLLGSWNIDLVVGKGHSLVQGVAASLLGQISS